MSAARILLQLDSDLQPSVFDAIVAIDAGVAQLLRHGGVLPEQVRDLVYGALFTRSPKELQNTAIFVGGANVERGEALFAAVQKTFFGPFRCSVLLDANGANTTAAAAVLAVEKHVALAGATALVLGGTGPVGQRVGRLLARAGASVRIGSRQQQKADDVRARLAAQLPQARFTAATTGTPASLQAALEGVQIVVSAGGPGAMLLPASARQAAGALKVAVDLNAVPPLGIEGVEAHDKAADCDGVVCFGAIGVGGTKMKIHTRAIQRLYESNDAALDAEEIFQLGRELFSART
jgi:methylenetetrahydrofolate/methylenetetrahydromethanopterin dehydrogenase (NADP+)